jgi:hypothetical protein
LYSKVLNYLYGSTCPNLTSPVNKEVILDRRPSAAALTGIFFYQGSAGFNTYNQHPSSPGVDFVRNNFRTIDGNDVNIPLTGGTFPDLKNIFKKMEPRFHAIVHVPGYYYSEVNNSQTTTWNGRDSTLFWYYNTSGVLTAAQTSNPANWFGPYHGFFFHKKWFTFGSQSVRISFPLFRLAEFYLNYAEAANEVNPNDPLILTYMNKIRTRGGLPNIQAVPVTNAKVGNKDLFRAEIQKERGVELWGEEQRYFDVRRWKMAEVNGGKWLTIELYENGTGSYVNPSAGWTAAQRAANNAKLNYRFVEGADAASVSPRAWESKMYFYPWSRSEIQKGLLIQNPGW